MLIAHLVPGYFAASLSQSRWRPEWGKARRTGLWIAALGATAAPDFDVVLNVASGKNINHSTLWTHSLFVHLVIALVWFVLWRMGRWPYVTTLVGLVAVGGLSHLVLDVIAHGTPLVYPLSSNLFGLPPARVVAGGLWAYLSDPIFLLEPALIAFALGHWIHERHWSPRATRWAFTGVIGAVIAFGSAFLVSLPKLQSLAGVLISSR